MNKQIWLRTVFYLFFVAMTACVVTASCLLSRFPTASYFIYGGAGAALLAQLLTALGVTLNRKTKLNGFEQWGTSLEVIAVCVALVALLPVILLLYIVDALNCAAARRSDKKNGI